MTEQRFALRPFCPTNPPHDVKILGKIARRSNRLAVLYELSGSLKELDIPAPSDKPARMHTLWKHTCFELFFGIRDSDTYWEFNLSPAGHWNVYRFIAYRQGMQEEHAFRCLPFGVENQSDMLRLTLEVDLDKIVPAAQALQVGISAVTKALHGKGALWALIHPGLKADFHRRDSFTVAL